MLLSAVLFAIIIGTIVIDGVELSVKTPGRLVPVRVERHGKHHSAYE